MNGAAVSVVGVHCDPRRDVGEIGRDVEPGVGEGGIEAFEKKPDTASGNVVPEAVQKLKADGFTVVETVVKEQSDAIRDPNEPGLALGRVKERRTSALDDHGIITVH